MKTVIFLSALAVTLSNPIHFHDLTNSNNQFASSIYKLVANQNEENFLVSPLSAEIILALSQAGARDDTALELQNALHLPPQKQLIDCMFANLMQTLQDEQDFMLQTFNKIYLKENCSIKSDFQMIAQEVYRGEVEKLDFANKDAATELINQWVQNQTDNKIANLIEPDFLSNETRSIFLNVLRFRANWSIPFHFFATLKRDFYLSDQTIQVDTMHIYDEYFDYYEKLNATFLELQLSGENITMTVVLPKARGDLMSLEDNIGEVLQVPEMKSRDMFNVALPKFKLESRINFKEVLQNLGVEKAFEDKEADFSEIAGEKGELFIDDIVQKTFLEVNEDGMEAAAATYIVKIVNRNAESSQEFNVNHPFLFFIKVNDLVLFLGRITTPSY